MKGAFGLRFGFTEIPHAELCLAHKPLRHKLQPFAELLSQTVDYASAEGAEQVASKSGGSLLGKFNFKSFAKKPKEASSPAG